MHYADNLPHMTEWIMICTTAGILTDINLLVSDLDGGWHFLLTLVCVKPPFSGGEPKKASNNKNYY